MRSHDPEASAAAFLAGEMTSSESDAFEYHLLECPPCWHEVRLGGLGRRVAEAGRELAPSYLRDRVRAAVELAPAPRRDRGRRPFILMLLLALAVLSVAPALLGRQPEAIRALLADFEAGHTLARPAPPTLPERLGDLRLIESTSGTRSDPDVTAHRYRDRAGHRVTVYRSLRAFPEARGARAHPESSIWEANLGGVTLLCASRPFHALVVGDDEAEVKMAARMLELR